MLKYSVKYEERIHGWIPSDIGKKFDDILQHGEVYEFKHFVMAPFKQKCGYFEKNITDLM